MRTVAFSSTSDCTEVALRSVQPLADTPLRVSDCLWDAALHQPAEKFLSRCGKRIREAIVQEAFCMAGGLGQPPAAVAEAIELLHAGSLIIDDIEDGSIERRGAPTLHLEIGLPLAINTGNWMYFRALEKLSDAVLSRAAQQRAMLQVIRTIRRCHEGQALDLSIAVDAMDPNQIRPAAKAISRLKTGGLTALSAYLGGIAGGGASKVRAALGQFGMGVGVCLQMHNDLNELCRFAGGAPRCDDLRNARVTWPWAWGVQTLDRIAFAELQRDLRVALGHEGRPTSAARQAAHLEMHDAEGTEERLRCVAERLLEAVGEIGQRSIDAKLERTLEQLGEHVPSTSSIRSILCVLQGPRGDA